jgi:three-Cys-motif partner protein
MTSRRQFGGRWTQQKLDLLRKYLSAYTTILSKQSQKFPLRFAYIDAFAGTGYRELKETGSSTNLLLPELAGLEPQQFLQGSARIALECVPAFHRYVFIEKDAAKIAELEANLRRDFPEKEKQIIFHHGDANTVIQDLCEKNWKLHRAVLFLDPFGMQVAWPTIEAIAGTRAIDLWILFPLGVAVNRLLTRDGQISEPWRRRLDEIFGADDWYKEFYRTTTTLTLFGEVAQTEKLASTPVIMDYFVRRLKSVFPHVAENPLPLYNSKHSPLYVLFFAAGHPKAGKTAVKIAQNILGS